MPISNNTTITTKIDWLSVTVAKPSYPSEWSTEKTPLKKGMLGYDTGIKYRDGRVELCSSTRADMGTHIIFSGSCLDTMCEQYKITSFDILHAMKSSKTSRIDLAIDVKNGCIDIRALEQMFEDGATVTNAIAKLYMTAGKDKGETLYIGSEKGNRRLRIYDKMAETKADKAWTRLELQIRHRMAQIAAKTIADGDGQNPPVAGIIRGFVDFPYSQEWGDVIGCDNVEMATVEKYKSNRAEWLLTTCVAALAAEMFAGYQGGDFLNDFVRATLKTYRSIQDDYAD